MTTQEERQAKIDSIKIDFSKDNVLPHLNAEQLEQMGVGDKPVLLKKFVIDKNRTHHPDVSEEDAAYMIGQALYNTEVVLPGNDKKAYYNFVTRIGDDKSVVCLLSVEITDEYFEIVNWHWLGDKARARKERKGREITAGKS